MDNIRNRYEFTELYEGASRQYINALSVFTALEDARRKAVQYRGGMYWKKHSGTGIEYLMRTQTDNSQTSIGARNSETEAVFEKFTKAKGEIEKRIQDLRSEFEIQRRMNRALKVGRTPQMLVDILNMFAKVGIAEHFIVVGTNALYAYETEAGVRIATFEALETNDVDLLWKIGKKVKFQAQMDYNKMSMIGLLRKIDKTFEIRSEQQYTAVNSKGFEVDIIRPIDKDERLEPKTNPSRMTKYEDDFMAVKASTAGKLNGAVPFTSVVVSASGAMARMNTVSPVQFIKVKRALAEYPDREQIKKRRDLLQADIIEELVRKYLPQYEF